MDALVGRYADHVLSLAERFDHKSVAAVFGNTRSMEELYCIGPEVFLRCLRNRTTSGTLHEMAYIKKMLSQTERNAQRENRSAPDPDTAEVIDACDLARSRISLLNVVTYRLACHTAEAAVSGESAVYLKNRQTLKLSLELLDPSHPLVTHIAQLHQHYATSRNVQLVRESSPLPVGGNVLKITEEGFKFEFRLPADCIRNDVVISGEALTELIYDACLYAEETTRSHHHAGDRYQPIIGSRSMLNQMSRCAPRLYDPLKNFRGRISESTGHAESIKNPRGIFGNPLSANNLAHVVDQLDSSTANLFFSYGTWTILSDGK